MREFNLHRCGGGSGEEAGEMGPSIWIFGERGGWEEREWMCLDWMEYWVGLARKREKEEE